MEPTTRGMTLALTGIVVIAIAMRQEPATAVANDATQRAEVETRADESVVPAPNPRWPDHAARPGSEGYSAPRIVSSAVEAPVAGERHDLVLEPDEDLDERLDDELVPLDEAAAWQDEVVAEEEPSPYDADWEPTAMDMTDRQVIDAMTSSMNFQERMAFREYWSSLSRAEREELLFQFRAMLQP